ncbi:MAG: class I SAM-dependent methyltransferase [Acidobacteria bacterium]|nr:class I SAM-dependent methyltransferase [Acidobacteriota bacterium]
MPLYVDLRRIYNELAEAGVGAGDALPPERLFPFDQIHYRGTDAVRTAAETLRLSPSSRVLEIGAGLGGPARFLAHTTGCHVTAVDVQEPMHAVACDLTARCGLASRVTHVHGDALTAALPDAGFDAVVSWLAIHHMPDRPRLFSRIARALRPNGQVYIEDLCQRAPFSAADLVDVREMLHATTLTGAEAFERDLRAAGVKEVGLTDMTGDWAAFCAERAAAWQAARDRHVRVHGAETYARLERFFLAVRRLFEGGSLGGLRIVARL